MGERWKHHPSLATTASSHYPPFFLHSHTLFLYFPSLLIAILQISFAYWFLSWDCYVMWFVCNFNYKGFFLQFNFNISWVWYWFCIEQKVKKKMPHRTRPMTALLVFTGLNVVLVSTITPLYDFVCFLPYWERRVCPIPLCFYLFLDSSCVWR